MAIENKLIDCFTNLIRVAVPSGSRVPKGAQGKDRLLIILSKTIYPYQFDQGASLIPTELI